MSEKQKKKEIETFEQMWEGSGDGEDYKGRAETIYNEAVTAGLSEPLIRGLVGLCRQLHGMDKEYYATFAGRENDINPLERDLKNHTHLPSGEAVKPL